MNECLVPRPVLVAAVRGLIDDVRSRRGQMPADAAERDFYLGVEAAAEEVLHPELAMARDDRWLAHEVAAFRDGYERTRIIIATVTSTPDMPLALRVPAPEAPSARS